MRQRAPGRHALAALLSLLGGASAAAADWYVSPSGSDSAAGSLAAPFRTVQRGVNVAAAGDTVWLRGGTYRESVSMTRAGTATAPIVVAAYAAEVPVIKGSQAVSGWTATATAGVWAKSSWSANSQQVFVDGVSLQQIGVPSSFFAAPASDGTTMYTPVGAGLADLVPGSFFYDATALTLYVRLADGGDPNAHALEASTARRLLLMDAGAAWITVRGISFRHCSSAAFSAAGAAIELGDHCTLDRCDVQWCDFAGVAMGYRRAGAVVSGCVISNNGDTGIGSSASWGFAVRDSVIAGNNQRRFNTAWHAGGLKLTSQSYGVIERCDISGNLAQGVWFDYCDSGSHCEVRRCRIAGNAARYGGGVMIEGSKNVTLVDNLIADNDRRGVYVAASDQVRVWHNTITGTLTQTAIDVSGMPRAGKTLTDVEIADNLVAGNACPLDLFLVKENGTDIQNLRCDYNLFWRSGGSIALRWALDARGGWAGTTYSSLAAWRAATGGGAHCLQADPLFAAGGQTLGIGSPAIDTGIACPGVLDDYLGNARPAGLACDIGAYESAGLPGGTHTDADSSGGDSALPDGDGALGGAPSTSVSAGPGGGCGLGGGMALCLLAASLVLKNALSWVPKRERSARP
jgi:parallel beta-helix repeat protein